MSSQVFSEKFLITRQDETPILEILIAARELMPVDYREKPVILAAVLWADDKSKPYKNISRGLSLGMVCKLTFNE